MDISMNIKYVKSRVKSKNQGKNHIQSNPSQQIVFEMHNKSTVFYSKSDAKYIALKLDFCALGQLFLED